MMTSEQAQKIADEISPGKYDIIPHMSDVGKLQLDLTLDLYHRVKELEDKIK